MLPLSFAQINQQYSIVKIMGKDSIRSRLREMGFLENEILSVKQNLSGNLIVEIKGMRIALDKELASRIFV